MNPVHVPPSKWRQALLLAGSLLFVALGIWIFSGAEALAVQGKRFWYESPLILRLLGLSAILFFGLCAFFGVKQMIGNKGGLVLTPAYFLFEISTQGVPLYWKDVTDIFTVQIQRTKIICVALADPEAYISQQTSGWKRWLMRQNLKSFGAAIWVSTNALAKRHGEVEKLMLDFWRHAQTND